MLEEQLDVFVDCIDFAVVDGFCRQEHFSFEFVLGLCDVVVEGVEICVEILGYLVHDVVGGDVRVSVDDHVLLE